MRTIRIILALAITFLPLKTNAMLAKRYMIPDQAAVVQTQQFDIINSINGLNNILNVLLESTNNLLLFANGMDFLRLNQAVQYNAFLWNTYFIQMPEMTHLRTDIQFEIGEIGGMILNFVHDFQITGHPLYVNQVIQHNGFVIQKLMDMIGQLRAMLPR